MTRAEYGYTIAGRPLEVVRDPPPRRALVADIITIAAKLSGISVATLKGKSRFRLAARPRLAAYAIALEHGHSSGAVGQRFGKDHSTILHGAKMVAIYIERSPDYAAFVDELRRQAAVSEPFLTREPPQAAVEPVAKTPAEQDEAVGDTFCEMMRQGSRDLAEALAGARA